MSIVIPEGYAEVSLRLVNSGDPDPWYLTHGIGNEAEVPTLEQLTTRLYVAAGYLAPILNTSTSITGANLRLGTSSGTPFSIFAPFDPVVQGESSAERLPSNCATLVRKFTNRPGRSGKGRFFMPSVPESAADQNGFVTTAWQTSTTGAWMDYFGALVDDSDPLAGPIEPMVLLHDSSTPGGSDPDLVLSLVCDPLLATQRRRMRR